jgi:UPF0271 protein
MRVDLNADVGEASDAASDPGPRIIPYITSASVAAGAHAGSPSVLRRTLRLIGAHAVAAGAHPGFADREGFGRRPMRLSQADAEDLVLYQVAAVSGVAAAEGLRLQHVKPHGALYNMAAVDVDLATAVARAIRAIDRELILLGPPRSALVEAAMRAGLRVAREGFPDRAYERDGSLVPRSEPGAVLDDPEVVVARAVRMVRERAVIARDGTRIALSVDTLCLHGDAPAAATLAPALREGLQNAGIRVEPLGAFL